MPFAPCNAGHQQQNGKYLYHLFGERQEDEPSAAPETGPKPLEFQGSFTNRAASFLSPSVFKPALRRGTAASWGHSGKWTRKQGGNMSFRPINHHIHVNCMSPSKKNKAYSSKTEKFHTAPSHVPCFSKQVFPCAQGKHQCPVLLLAAAISNARLPRTHPPTLLMATGN